MKETPQKKLVLRATLKITLLFCLWSLSAACYEDIGPPPVPAKLRITPEKWIIEQKLLPGEKLYKKFTFERIEPIKDSEIPTRWLKIQEIRVRGSQQFQVYKEKDCPPPKADGYCYPLSGISLSEGRPPYSFLVEYTKKEGSKTQSAELIFRATTNPSPRDWWEDYTIPLLAK